MAYGYRKLVFVNRYYAPDRSATSQLLAQLAEHLADSGAEVVVLTSRQLYGRSKAGLRPKEVINQVLVRRVWTTSFGRSYLPGRALDYVTFYAAAFFSMLRLLGPGDCVVAKTDPPMVSVVAIVAACLRRATVVNWIQDLFPEVATKLGVGVVAWLEPLLCSVRNASLRRSRATVVLSEGMKDVLASQGVPSAQMVVIPNWSDGKAISPIPREQNPLRRTWGLSDHFVVAYSGNMGRAHSFVPLLDAIYRFRDDARFTFIFIGDGAKRAELERFVRSRRLHNVSFKPLQDPSMLHLSLSAADLHVTSLIPALEGLIVPSKVYGILAAGRPVLHIGDPGGEIGSMVSRYDCGLAVTENDADAAVGYIEELCVNPQRRTVQGINARRLFERRFDKPRALAMWRDLLIGDSPGIGSSGCDPASYG